MSLVKLHRVYVSELETLREYVEALYAHAEDYDSMVNIDEGLKNLLKHEQLAVPYFIMRGPERVGYVILTRYYSVEKGGVTLYVDEFYVEEPFRKQGIGGQIVDKIVELARAEGAKTLWVQTESHNHASISFFRGKGFGQNGYLNFELPL